MDESSFIEETANVDKKEVYSDNSNSVVDSTKGSDQDKDFDKQESKEKAAKAERKNTKKLSKDFAVCKIILEEMEVSWESSACEVWRFEIFFFCCRCTMTLGPFYYQ